MNINSLDIKLLADGTADVVLNTSDRTALNHLSMLSVSGKPLVAEIKQVRKRRSLSANSYCWILCDKIAQKLKSTKEDVYKEAIKQVGVFDYMAIKNEAVEAFLSRWKSMGLGYYAIVTEKAQKDDYKVVMAYYGSHVYDTAQMCRLIDYIVEEAKEIGIETLTPDELAKMKAQIGE